MHIFDTNGMLNLKKEKKKQGKADGKIYERFFYILFLRTVYGCRTHTW